MPDRGLLRKTVWTLPKRMEQHAGPAKGIAKRFAYGAAAYWALYVILVAVELRWHILYRLTLWDVEQLKTLAPTFAQLMHH